MVTKSISFHQTVSTGLTLIRNSFEIDKKGHTIIENMGQSGNSLVERPGWHVLKEKIIKKFKSEGRFRIAVPTFLITQLPQGK